ncbi:efflux transporter outer membrane subunit [Verrucomicrobiaceae bacterium 227]
MKSTLLLSLLLASCTVGPSYQRQDPSAPATYKAVGLTSTPPTGNWWSSFSDSTLDSLLAKAKKANPQSRAALARLDQSRAILGLRRADLLPSLTGEVLSSRQQDTTRDIFELPGDPYSRYRSALNLSYEIDFWGRVRRSVSEQQALTQAAAADYVTALLSTKAEVTRDYLALRHLDSEIQLLSNTIQLREENEKLVQARVDAGDTTAIDSSRARSQTETARADLHRLTQRRTELENALAVLTGTNPSSFKLGHATPPRTPSVPSGVPADLLRRRPDVAATERKLAAAAEEIGVTIANYLPRVSLTATGGFAALSTSDLFDKGSKLWTIGPGVTFPLTTFGRRNRDIEHAKAAYREALENHRLSILNAFRDVENALSGITNLDRALAAQEKSAAASGEASRLIKLRYETGLISFFEVIDAQREHLTEQRALVQTKAARQQATVQLIQALGGGWK